MHLLLYATKQYTDHCILHIELQNINMDGSWFKINNNVSINNNI